MVETDTVSCGWSRETDLTSRRLFTLLGHACSSYQPLREGAEFSFLLGLVWFWASLKGSVMRSCLVVVVVFACWILNQSWGHPHARQVPSLLFYLSGAVISAPQPTFLSSFLILSLPSSLFPFLLSFLSSSHQRSSDLTFASTQK